MNEPTVAALCVEAAGGSLGYTQHYLQQLFARPTPTRDEIRYLLCEDEADIIEDYMSERGRSCLIWAIMGDGRIGHIICSYPPGGVVITAYWPMQTKPEGWEDNYRRRVRQ